MDKSEIINFKLLM